MRLGNVCCAGFLARVAAVATVAMASLRDSGLAILVECGAEDQADNDVGNEFLHRVLAAQGIPHEYRLVPGEGHFPVAPERFLATFAFIGGALGHEVGIRRQTPRGDACRRPR